MRALIVDARTTDYTGDLIDACVDAVFESYGSTDVTALLVDLGVGRDDLIFGLQQLAPVLLDALRENGALDTIVRDRLAPFFESPALAKILDRATKPVKPKPTKDA